MSDRAAALTDAARSAVSMARDLVTIASPTTWWLPAGACLAGVVASGGSPNAGLLLAIAWLTLPLGLLRGGLEALVRGEVPGDPLRLAIAAANLPLLVVLVLVAGGPAGLAITALIALAVALAWPPVRIADRPAVDLAAEAALPVLAALVGVLVAGSGAPVELAWLALATAGAWTLWLVALAAADAAPRTGPTPLTGTVRVIGRHGLAAVALGGIAVATVAAGAAGGHGLLLAVGIAVLAVLPAMLLVRPAGPSGDRSDAAAAVRAELPWLLGLIGAFAGVLLLHARGVLAVTSWTVAVTVPAAVAGCAVASIIATRIATWRRRVGRSDPGAVEVPSLAIVVASHDSIAALPAALAAARSQTYADVTTLVVDAGSSDGSREEAAAWLGADAILDAGPAPAGWSPRDWAWHRGVTATESDLVLLVEDGTVLAPIAARVLVEQATKRRADLLSGVLCHAMPTAVERAGTPGLPLVLFGLVPIWWSALTRGRPAAMAFAHDGFVLVRRASYLAARDGEMPQAGGAVALARDVARGGGRVGTVHAARLGTTRPRPGPDGIIAAWRAAFVPMVGGRIASALVVLALSAIGFVAPLLLPPAALLLRVDADLVAASAVPLVILLAARILLLITQRHPPTTLLWHPVTVGLLLAGQAAAIAEHIRGPRGPAPAD